MNKNVNAIRILSIDMVQKANSGHPGICLGAAPSIYSLYAKEMKVYAKKSKWINRDRFILAAGHGSAMLYSTLHLSGYDLSMEDLKGFRSFGSKTPGHPEYNHTDGVDSTSGPLGQGIAAAVGMALSEEHLKTKFNKYSNVIDHHTYVICGDGDLQEGVSSEASSLAGHLGLRKLIVLWDSNNIQLDDRVNVATSEDIHKRYEAYGWNTLFVEDGNDEESIIEAVKVAKKSDKPTLIEVKTIIGYGSKNKQDSSKAHGAPLGEDEVQIVKDFYNWTEEKFEIDNSIYDDFRENTISNGEKEYNFWLNEVEILKENDIELYNKFIEDFSNIVPEIKNIEFSKDESIATRVASGKIINNINEQIFNLIGGSADLSSSNNTLIKGERFISKDDYSGKNIAYGVREFAMAAIANGITLHGGLKTFCSTFFVFSDYLKPAIRLSAIQNIGTIYVLTHDSIAVGEDGPTHQPIEQLTGLRSIPNIDVYRPCDANETQAAWQIALKTNNRPSILALTRQNVNCITDNEKTLENVQKGGYIISDSEDFDKVLIASGSEVELCLKAKVQLEEKGIKVRVVSMPNINQFERQSEEYKEYVLGKTCMKNRYFVEMSKAVEGYKYARNLINIETFGMSGEGARIIEEFGFTVENITESIMETI